MNAQTKASLSRTDVPTEVGLLSMNNVEVLKASPQPNGRAP